MSLRWRRQSGRGVVVVVALPCACVHGGRGRNLREYTIKRCDVASVRMFARILSFRPFYINKCNAHKHRRGSFARPPHHFVVVVVCSNVLVRLPLLLGQQQGVCHLLLHFVRQSAVCLPASAKLSRKVFLVFNSVHAGTVRRMPRKVYARQIPICICIYILYMQ